MCFTNIERALGVLDQRQLHSKVMMNKSPIIDEIRAYREEHARSCGFDLERIVEDTRRVEQKLREEGWTLVTEKAEKKPPAGPKTPQ